MGLKKQNKIKQQQGKKKSHTLYTKQKDKSFIMSFHNPEKVFKEYYISFRKLVHLLKYWILFFKHF